MACSRVRSGRTWRRAARTGGRSRGRGPAAAGESDGAGADGLHRNRGFHQVSGYGISSIIPTTCGVLTATDIQELASRLREKENLPGPKAPMAMANLRTERYRTTQHRRRPHRNRDSESSRNLARNGTANSNQRDLDRARPTWVSPGEQRRKKRGLDSIGAPRSRLSQGHPRHQTAAALQSAFESESETRSGSDGIYGESARRVGNSYDGTGTGIQLQGLGDTASIARYVRRPNREVRDGGRDRDKPADARDGARVHIHDAGR